MLSLNIINVFILVGAALVLFGILSSLAAARFGAPLLLVFMIIGMLVGQDGPGGIAFNDYGTTYLIGSLALSVILFDGGLRTRLATFRGTLAPSLLLATVGVLVTAGLTGLAAYLIIDQLSILEAFLLGAIVASTDAAAVFFLLRSSGLRLKGKAGSVLEIESGTNDPIAIFLAITLTEIVVLGAGETQAVDLLVSLGQQAAIGAAFGALAGIGVVRILNGVTMSDGLHPLFVVTTAIMIYAFTSLMGGSGLLAVYLAGLVLANRPVRAYPSIVGFHDAATWLCQIVMFLVLGLLVTPSTLVNYAVPGILLALVLTFLARPVAVWLCLTPFGYSRKEKTFISWVGLRGAVSIFLAAIPTLAGTPHAEIYFNIAFFVVLVSLLVQGWTVSASARWLDMALKRSGPKVKRFEVDIPGQLDRELVGYPVTSDTLVLGVSRLPEWARPVLIVRDGDILNPIEAGPFLPGDYVYLLAPLEDVGRLDRLFEASPDIPRRLKAQFGELPLNGDALIGDVAQLYDLEVDPAFHALSVSDYFQRNPRHSAQVGSRASLGGAMIIARAVEDGRVTRASLMLKDMVEALVSATPAPETRLSRLGGAALERARPLRERMQDNWAWVSARLPSWWRR